MKSKQKTMGTVVLMLIIVFAVAIGFWRIMEDKREKAQEQAFIESSNKEVNEVLKKDFDVNYPSTPREVMKNYSRINSCVYNYDDLSEKELIALTQQMRKLFDEELLASNPLDAQFKSRY